jgi:hypothetical protein
LAGLRLQQKWLQLRLRFFWWSGFSSRAEAVLRNVWQNNFTCWINIVKYLNYPSLYFFIFLFFLLSFFSPLIILSIRPPPPSSSLLPHESRLLQPFRVLQSLVRPSPTALDSPDARSSQHQPVSRGPPPASRPASPSLPPPAYPAPPDLPPPGSCSISRLRQGHRLALPPASRRAAPRGHGLRRRLRRGPLQPGLREEAQRASAVRRRGAKVAGGLAELPELGGATFLWLRLAQTAPVIGILGSSNVEAVLESPFWRASPRASQGAAQGSLPSGALIT